MPDRAVRRAAQRWSRRSGWSSGTCTSTRRTPSGAATHTSTSPHGSRCGPRRTSTPAAASRSCSARDVAHLQPQRHPAGRLVGAAGHLDEPVAGVVDDRPAPRAGRTRARPRAPARRGRRRGCGRGRWGAAGHGCSGRPCRHPARVADAAPSRDHGRVPPSAQPPSGPAAVDWVATHLGHLSCDTPRASADPGRPGGRRPGAGEARPDRLRASAQPGAARRGAGRLAAVAVRPARPADACPGCGTRSADAPPADRTKYRDELMWQEYARHLYARLGADARPVAARPTPPRAGGVPDPGRARWRASTTRRRARGRRVAGQPDPDVAGLAVDRARRAGLAGGRGRRSSATCSTAPAPPTGWAGSGRSAPAPASPTASAAGRSRSGRPACAARARSATPARSSSGPTSRPRPAASRSPLAAPTPTATAGAGRAGARRPRPRRSG